MKSFGIAVGTLVAFLVLVVSAFAVWWGYDVWKDRQHTIVVRQNTMLFAGARNAGCDGSPLGVILPGPTAKVRRIRYWKNCATIDVKLSDDRAGYIVPMRGNVAVSPDWP